MSSPPGQFNEVLRDVKKLLPANLLTDIVTSNVARAYNVKTGRVVVSPDHNKVVLFNASEVDATHYTDPITQHIFTVDHLTLVRSHLPRCIPIKKLVNNVYCVSHLFYADLQPCLY